MGCLNLRLHHVELCLCSSGGHSESVRGLVSGSARTALCPFNTNKTPSDYDILLPPQGSLPQPEHISTPTSPQPATAPCLSCPLCCSTPPVCLPCVTQLFCQVNCLVSVQICILDFQSNESQVILWRISVSFLYLHMILLVKFIVINYRQLIGRE